MMLLRRVLPTHGGAAVLARSIIPPPPRAALGAVAIPPPSSPLCFHLRPLSTTTNIHKQLNDRLEACKTAKELERVIAKSPTPAFSGSNYVTAINMLGKLGSTKSDVIVRMLNEAEEVEIDAQELAELCFGIGWGELLEEMPPFVIDQLLRDCHELSTADITSILMSFAALEHRDAQVCARLAGELLSRDCAGMDSSELALVLKCFSALDYYDAALCDAVASEVLRRLRAAGDAATTAFKEDEVAMILHSLALFDYKHKPELLLALRDLVLQRPLEAYSVNDFALILSAFTKLGFASEAAAVCDRFAQFVLELSDLEDFELDEIQLILHTFAEFKLKDLEVVRLFAEEFCSRDLHSLAGDDFALNCKSFYQLKYPDTFVALLFCKYLVKRNEKEFYGSDMASILQYMAYVDVASVEGSINACGKVCSKFIKAVEARHKADVASSTTTTPKTKKKKADDEDDDDEDEWEFFEEPGDLAVFLSSLRALKCKIPGSLVDAIAYEANRRSLSSFASEDVKSLIDTLRALGCGTSTTTTSSSTSAGRALLARLEALDLSAMYRSQNSPPTTATATTATKQESVGVSQVDGSKLCLVLADGTRVTFQKDGTSLLPSNAADLQKIAELSSALASSKLEVAKLTQDLLVAQRERREAQEELAQQIKKHKPVGGGGVVSFTTATLTVTSSSSSSAVATATPTAAAPKPVGFAYSTNNNNFNKPKPVVEAAPAPSAEITRAADVTEPNVAAHLAGKFDVNKLVSSDAEQNAKYGAAPLLFWAAYGGQTTTVDMLLKAGARRDVRGKSNETALEVCVRKQRSEECIQLLKAAAPAPAPAASVGFTRGPAPKFAPSYLKPVAAAAPSSPVASTQSSSASPVAVAVSSLASSFVAAECEPIAVLERGMTPTPEPQQQQTPVAAPAAPTVVFVVAEPSTPPDVAAAEPITPPTAATEEQPPAANRPLTFLERRRLSMSQQPVISGALDVSALRSGLKPAAVRVVPVKPQPEPEPAPAPAPVPAEGAPPVRVNKLADRMKMFERKA